MTGTRVHVIRVVIVSRVEVVAVAVMVLASATGLDVRLNEGMEVASEGKMLARAKLVRSKQLHRQLLLGRLG